MGGGKLSSVDKYGTDYGNFALRFTPTDRPFTKPNWDNIMTKRDKPAMSEAEFDEAIKELARKEFATGKRGCYCCCSRVCKATNHGSYYRYIFAI